MAATERIGIVIVAGLGMVSLAVVAIFKVITDGVTDRDGQRLLRQRLAKGEIAESDYRRLRDLLHEKP